LVAGEIIEIQPNLVETKTTRKKGAQRAKKGKFSPLLHQKKWFGDVVRDASEFRERIERGGRREKEEEIESQTRTWSQDLYF